MSDISSFKASIISYECSAIVAPSISPALNACYNSFNLVISSLSLIKLAPSKFTPSLPNSASAIKLALVLRLVNISSVRSSCPSNAFNSKSANSIFHSCAVSTVSAVFSEISCCYSRIFS